MRRIFKEQTKLYSTPYGKAVKIHVLVEQYFKSERFRMLSDISKKNYISRIKTLEELTLPNNRSILEEYAHRIKYQTVDYLKRILLYKMKPASVASHFAVLSIVWEVAIRTGYVSSNPWYKSRIRVDNMREVVWTVEQINSAVNTAVSNGYDLLALYILMGYSTGQRPYSDLRELKWENFKQEGDRYILDFIISKTNTHLMLPLDEKITNTLLGLERVSEYIFAGKNGKRLSATCINNQLNKVKFKCGIPAELKMRDLRRTAVTELAQSGATVSEITAITGWKCSEKVLNRYAVMRLNTADNALAKRKAFQDANTISKSDTVLPDTTVAE